MIHKNNKKITNGLYHYFVHIYDGYRYTCAIV